MRHDRELLASHLVRANSSIEICVPPLIQPFARNVDFDACDADRAPHFLASLACDVLMILREVERHREGPAFEALHRTSHEKNLSDLLT